MPADEAEEKEPIDPTVDTAPAQGWRHWATELGTYQQERVVGFGGVVVAGFLAGVVVLYAFAWLANEVLERETAALDAAALDIAHRFASPQLTLVMQLISMLGSEVVIGLGAVLLVLFSWQRRWVAAFMLVLITGGAQLLNNVLKAFFHRTRPEPLAGVIAATGFSFPSGHAMVSAAFYFYLAYLAWRLIHGWRRVVLIVFLALLVLLIGLSRIYLGAHYPSDVIAGYLAGLLWTDTVIVGSRLLIPGPRRRPQPARATDPARSEEAARTLNG